MDFVKKNVSLHTNIRLLGRDVQICSIKYKKSQTVNNLKYTLCAL